LIECERYRIVAVARHDGLLVVLARGYKPAQPLNRHRPLKHPSVPKNSRCYSSFADRGKFALYGLHFSLSCSQPPAIPHILVVLIAACAHDRIANTLPAPGSPSVGQDHETPFRDSCKVDGNAFFDSVSVSTLHGTCNPISCGLNIVRCLWSLLSRDLERSEREVASLLFLNRQTFVVPRKSWGFI